MTDDFDVSLRRRLEGLAAAVPVAPPGEVMSVIPREVRARSRSRLALAGLVPALGVLVAGTFLASLAGVDPFAQTTGLRAPPNRCHHHRSPMARSRRRHNPGTSP